MLGIIVGVICLVLLPLPYINVIRKNDPVIVYWLPLVYYVLMCIQVVY